MSELTPRLSLPLIAASQAQKHVPVNEALMRLDALVQLSVLNRTLTAPPVSPENGDRHIVAAGATGAWSGQDRNIACYDAGWIFAEPGEGWLAWDRSEQTLVVFRNGEWSVVTAAGGDGGRPLLTGDRTYYVRTDGNDGNDGLTNTAGGAFLTIQRAIDVITALDLGGHSVTIQIADGTYTGAISLTTPFIGGLVHLVGNTAAPTNVLISHNSLNAFVLNGAGVRLSISGIKIQNSAASALGSGIVLLSQAVLDVVGTVEFGTCTRYHLEASALSVINVLSSYIISGSAIRHWSVNQGAKLIMASLSITLMGTPAFPGAFCFAQLTGAVVAFNFTFSGSATGKRYDVTINGAVNAYGGGPSYFPGDVAGTTASGGQYI